MCTYCSSSARYTRIRFSRSHTRYQTPALATNQYGLTRRRIVELKPMRVASVYAFGKEPEGQAVDKLIASAKPKGFLDDRENHRIFGFNNPSPSPGSPNYGYEIWITVKPDVEPEGEVRIKEFNGGLYAVTHCEVIDGNYELIGATWKKLITWRKDSKYDCGYYQWLEETIRMESVPPGDLVLDLHLPISA